MNKKLKKVIIILVVLILVVVGASMFVGEGSQTTSPLQSVSTGTTGAPLAQSGGVNASSSNTEEINREFISILLNLESIDLNDDIFSEPAFTALVDNSVRLNQPGNEGRPNPFAPIGTDALNDNSNLGASVGSFDTMSTSETTISETPNASGDQSDLNLEGVDSSDDLTDEQLDEALSSLGSS